MIRYDEKHPAFDAHLSPEALEAHIRDVSSLPAHSQKRAGALGGALASLRRSFMTIAECAREGEDLLAASAWLLDNYPFLEEEIAGASRGLKRQTPLPALSSGEIRVLRLMREAVAHTDATIDSTVIAGCAKAYLSLRSLRMGELWALPRFAASALLEAAANVAAAAARSQRERMKADAYVHKVEDGADVRLSEADLKNPIIIEHICARLREAEVGQGLAWLDEQLSAQEVDRDRMVAAAHRLQSLWQLRIANCVKSLRALKELNWQPLFEELSAVETVLRDERAGVYPRMDFASRDVVRKAVENLARGHSCPEEQVARTARALADASSDREAHVGYYLLDEGKYTLSESLRTPKFGTRLRLFAERHAKGLYMGAVWLLSWAIPAAILPWQGALVALLSNLPATSLAQRWVGALARKLFPPRILLKLDFENGIPEDAATAIVVPTLLTSPAQARKQARQLEIYRIANRGDNLCFMLLTDFADHDAYEKDGDQEVLGAAREEIEALREQYGPVFGILHRPRMWNEGQGRYIGRERKRGALEDLNAYMLGKNDGAFCLELPPDMLKRCPFVLTVDADTVLPPGAAAKLAGALAHPMNRYGEDGRGHALLAPRIENLPGHSMTKFQKLYSGRLGIDIYGAAASEIYQDLSGEGIYSGKGIYDVAAFSAALYGKIKPNSVLSHDLLEGLFARAALASDVVFYDAQPRAIGSWAARLHRWTRGDWQLVPYLFRKDVDSMGKWKLSDNLRRSLTPAATALTMLLGTPLFVPVALLLVLGLPRHKTDWWSFLVKSCFLPYEAVTQVDAALRALWRTLISHKHMLDWVTAAQVEQQKDKGQALWRAMFVNVLWSVLALASSSPWLAALWLPGALLAKRLERPAYPEKRMQDTQRDFLMDVARATYGWFERNAGREDCFLPPDNVQYKPYRGAAHRTSPTNIGLCLTADVAARDLGLIGDADMLERLSRRLDSIERLETWKGHLYNWYSTQTLRPLRPLYVSSVDGGNFAACLWAAAAAAREVGGDVAEDIARRCNSFVADMDFSLLYDRNRRLFTIGYDAESDRMSASHYDLLASEARLLSMIAIAKGDAPPRHWGAPGRPLTCAGGKPTLLSWSGTMFEYLMPRLFLRDLPGTLLDETNKGAVAAQIEAAKGRPWGESESGYYAFDLDLNYQYKAFGVPALSMKGGLPGETVVAPYASLLALLIRPDDACRNLDVLAQSGYLGDEGFFEAIDYTPNRIPEGQSAATVCSTMAHHQGMGLLALEGALSGRFVNRFGEIPAIRAHAVLLSERAPDRYIPARTRPTREHRPRTFSEQRAARNARAGEAHLLSGAGTTMALAADATGYIAHEETALTRFRAGEAGPFGALIYLRDADSGETLRVGADNCTARFEGGKAVYTTAFRNLEARVSFAVTPEDGSAVVAVALSGRAAQERHIEICCYLEPVLAPQRADRAHRAYMDLFLEAQDVRSGLLFYRRRPRSRGEATRLLAIASCGDGMALPSQISRMGFIGRRGDLNRPIGLRSWPEEPKSSWSAPIEPCAAMARRLTILPGERAGVHFAILYGEHEEALRKQAEAYLSSDGAERAFAMAATRAQVEMSYLGLTASKLRLYERIAYALLHPFTARSPAQAEAAQRLIAGQSELWRFGVSGDLPIILMRIEDVAQISMAREIAAAHEYLRMKGLLADLVLMNDYGNDYRQPVRDKIDELIGSSHLRSLTDCPGGVFVLNSAELNARQIDLLLARSAVLIEGSRGSAAEQLPAPREYAKERITPRTPGRRALELASIDTRLDNGFGGFAREGREYVIRRRPPAPWSNVIANPSFGTLVTDTGFCYTWAGNSRERKLTPWCNDPVLERHGEGVRLRDDESGEVFFIDERCRHGQGYSIYESGYQGLLCEMTVFVDAELPIKCSSVHIQNPGKDARSLSFDAWALWALAADRDEGAVSVATGKEGDLLWARNGYHGDGAAFLYMVGAKPVHISCDAAEIGASAQATSMSGIQRGGDPCALLRAPLIVPAGDEITIHVLLGWAEGLGDASGIAARFDPAASLAIVRAQWDNFLNKVRITTPDEGMNILLNRWLPYQALSSRMWGRTAFYQAGGAYGFRDQLQDAAMLAYYDPTILKEQILRCAEHQFAQGDVQHWWHEPRHGVRTRIRDDMLFLPWAVAHYVKITGDLALLDIPVRYLEAPVLEPGEEDRYASPALGGEGTIMEHCLRALEQCCRFGEHGLPLMGGGDWNDAMNRVGIEGRGESVWLGWFLCHVLGEFAPLCPEEAAQSLVKARGRIAAAIEEHGWDGAWYRRAYYDEGAPMGARRSACCEIDLIAQAWAAISGAGDPERARGAMDEALNHLLDPVAGILKLLDPPFDGSGPEVGYIAGYIAGVRENGGQYTHGAAWGALALAALGEADRCRDVLGMLLPIGKNPAIYRTEPYAVAADVYAGEHAGRGGWTWYTGSAAWLWRAAVEGLCGLSVEDGRARLEPNLPTGWSVSVEIGGNKLEASGKGDPLT